MGLLENAQNEFLTFAEQATAPATPSAGMVAIYRDADGNWYEVDGAGTVTQINGVGGAGGIGVEAARVETLQSTASGTYTDLSTAGPAVTVDVPATGILVVNLGSMVGNDNASGGALMSFALSGANTQAADDAYAIGTYLRPANGYERIGRRFVLTGLSSGATTITAKYRRAAAGNASFQEREVSAEVGFTAA